MKAFFLSLILMACSHSLVAQQAEIDFYYDKCGYKNVAQERLMKLYSERKSRKASIYPMTSPLDKYKAEELDLISIPILGWNHQRYKCGDNLEPLVAFKQDVLYQEVFLVTKKKHVRVGIFSIYDSYIEKKLREYGIDNEEDLIYGLPTAVDTDRMERKIHKFCLKNPHIFVFMLQDLHGYWAVIDGKLVKLVVKGFKIVGVSGSEFVCKRYGEEFINDAITDSLRTGYGYPVCSDCEMNNPIKINIIDKKCPVSEVIPK